MNPGELWLRWWLFGLALAAATPALAVNQALQVLQPRPRPFLVWVRPG